MKRKLNFSALRKVMDQIDDNGERGRCGNWEMDLGGYDHGYEISYRIAPIGRVNYELREYELYDDDFMPKEQIPEFLAAIDARGFTDVGEHEEDDLVGEEVDIGWDLEAMRDDALRRRRERDARAKLDEKKIVFNGREMQKKYAKHLISNAQRDDVISLDKYKELLSVFDQAQPGDEFDIPEMEKYLKSWFVQAYAESRKVNEESFGNLKTFLAKKEKEFKPSGVNSSWEDSEDKVWAIQEYLSSMGEFTDEDKEFLKKTNPEILAFFDGDEGQDMVNEASRKMRFRKIVKEARLPVMWAIDYRNMHTGIHGLYYGKDRKRVEEFANEIEYIQKNDDLDWDEKQYAWENLMEEFPDIGTIDEINFRDIGKLPSGKYGIIIDDVEYRLVNNVAIDLYEESDEKQNPDFKSLDQATWEIGRTPDGKKQNESEDEGGSDHPRIYVGTYAKYNDGSLDGKWIDISKYNTYDEFVAACRELHKDEKDPEFMVQDYENFPEKWYHESGLPTEEEFNKINDFYMMDDDRKAAYEAYVNHTDDDDIEHFEEAYQGHFDSASDFAYDLVDGIGWDGVGQNNLEMYFDYDSFGRDLMYDFHRGDEDETDAEGNPEDPDHYYDQDGYDMGEYESDEQVAYDYIDSIGGVDQLGKDTAQRYFDYDSFGRDLLINDYFEEDGYVFLRM